MQAIFHDRVDTFTGVRGGMGPPSDELPSETPREQDSIDDGIDVNEAFDDTLISAGPAEALRSAEILGS